ncbi:hypothetical protein V8G54_006936 [Vigna mungo]|uniref:Uncharacterized protein n=1 Tax=Vigna mungo TaxID=3915 RepID=A0AAQ3S501_VIGMU
MINISIQTSLPLQFSLHHTILGQYSLYASSITTTNMKCVKTLNKQQHNIKTYNPHLLSNLIPQGQTWSFKIYGGAHGDYVGAKRNAQGGIVCISFRPKDVNFRGLGHQ